MKQHYWDMLRNSYKKDCGVFEPTIGYETSEWSARIFRCAKRLLSAICFRETAESTYRKTGSKNLPLIGFYYSLYHMGVAMLYVEYTIPLPKLRKIRHSTLQNLIQDKFIEKSFIPQKYLDLLIELKDIREYTNYSFGYRIEDKTNSYYKQTGHAFNSALNFIKMISNEINEDNSLLFQISAIIGDVIGDDTYMAYLSKEDMERVDAYLILKNLTT